jgi:hypothetical protein
LTPPLNNPSATQHPNHARPPNHDCASTARITTITVTLPQPLPMSIAHKQHVYAVIILILFVEDVYLITSMMHC